LGSCRSAIELRPLTYTIKSGTSCNLDPIFVSQHCVIVMSAATPARFL
jgi:hypothetical protein